MLQMFLLNLGISLITKYIKSSSSSNDDKVLEVVKSGAKYLANKTNNDLSSELADTIIDSVMNKGK